MPGALILSRTSAAVAALIPNRSSSKSSSLDLAAGILFLDQELPDHIRNLISSNDPIIGLSCSTLRCLSLSSGSWALVKNLETSVSRAAKVLALDPPLDPPLDDESHQPSPAAPDLPNFFPTCKFSGKTPCMFSSNVAYVSPVLAFNLAFHLQWIESLVIAGSSDDSPLGFDKLSSLKVRVEALEPRALKVASHVRISYVKIPSVMLPGVVESCSPSENRQDEIDESLRVHFKGGGIVGAGDLLCLTLNSSTVSEFYQRFHYGGQDDNFIRFKVISIEPATEEFVLVDDTRTALVLSGSVASQLPPLVLKQTPVWCSSLHTPAVRELVSLVAPWLHPRMVSLRISTLLLGPAGVGKRTAVRLVAEALGIHVVEYNCYELLGATDSKVSLAIENAFKVASSYSPAILLLRRLGALGENAGRNSTQSSGPSRLAAALKNFITTYARRNISVYLDEADGSEDSEAATESSQLEKTETSVMLIATADDEDSVKSLRHFFTHEITIGSPDENQRFELLKSFLKADKYPDISDDLERGLKNISSQTAGLLPRDLKSVAADVGAFALEKHFTQSLEEPDGTLTAEALEKALEQVKKRTASAIGTPKVPNVKWEDIGGLENVKRAILDTVQLPLLHRELFTAGLKQRSGLLLYGPPGTGKTLLAKAVATECSLNFLSVKGPELINMFIGESEKNVREIFQKARGARPCIVFFDELDALAPARGASGDSGGVMDRVVSQMLAEIDGLGDGSQDLFVIGATNRPDLIDSALLRPGRFDKLLYVGISADPSYRLKVLSALTRKFDLDEEVSLNFVARRCSDNFTGADLYALCADAWMHAVKRKASNAEEDEARVVVKQEDFMHALRELKPSLSMSELGKYERLRLQFQGLA